MRRISWLTLSLALGLAIPSSAAPPEAAPAAERVRKLIEQLGNRDYRLRVEAVEALKKMGTEALPELRKALNHADPEVRKRAEEVAPGIEQAAALAPKRVTLKLKRKTTREVLNALTRQTGYQIDYWGGDEQQVYSVDVKDRPFWEAVDEISRTCGINVQPGYGDDRLRFQKEGSFVPHVCYDGPFRCVPYSFQLHRSVSFARIGEQPRPASRSESLSLSFHIFAEPRMPLLGVGAVRLKAAYDSENHSMLPEPVIDVHLEGGPRGRFMGSRSSRYGSGNISTSYQTQVNLKRGSEKAQKLKVVRGSVPVILLAERKPEVVTDKLPAAKGKKFKVGTTTFEIEDFQQTPNKQYQIKMTLKEDKLGENDYTWVNSLHRRLEVRDDKGNKYQMRGSSWHNHSASHVRITFTYGPPGNGPAGPPTKLVYQSWKTMRHEINFEFKDLPLP